MQPAETKYLRRLQGITKFDRIRNERLGGELPFPLLVLISFLLLCLESYIL